MLYVLIVKWALKRARKWCSLKYGDVVRELASTTTELLNCKDMAVADLGEGPGGLVPPLIFRPKWGPKGWKSFFWGRPTQTPLTQGLDDRPPPSPPLLSEGLDPSLYGVITSCRGGWWEAQENWGRGMWGIKERKGQDVGVLKGWEVGKRWMFIGNNP